LGSAAKPRVSSASPARSSDLNDQVARDTGSKPRYTALYRLKSRFRGISDKPRRVPQDEDGMAREGCIRGIIACLGGFVGGKQSVPLCRQTYYRGILYIFYIYIYIYIYIMYTHTYIHTRPFASFSSYFRPPQWRPHVGVANKLRRASLCRRVALPRHGPSINSASLVHCDLFPKPRTARARTPRDVSSALSSRAVGCMYAAFTLHSIMSTGRHG